MKIVLTGATGFTGSHLLNQMHAAGIQPKCLVRAERDVRELRERGFDVIGGNLDDARSLAVAFRGCDTLVNTASLGFGHAPKLVAAAEDAGIRRAVFLSTTAIFTTLDARTKAVRMAAETCIRESTLAWTIIRPTMIYGSGRDRNLSRLIRFLHRWAAIPIVGDGRRLQQPVYVENVAEAVLAAVTVKETVRRAYNIAGERALSFNEVVDTVARLLQKRVRRIHLPVAPILVPLQWFERIGFRFPIRSEQILRLNEDKAFNYDDATRDFGYAPLSLDEGLRRELAEMGLHARDSRSP